MSAPNQWRHARHARPGRTRIPDQRSRVLLFLLLFSLGLAVASVPVAAHVGRTLIQEALAP